MDPSTTAASTAKAEYEGQRERVAAHHAWRTPKAQAQIALEFEQRDWHQIVRRAVTASRSEINKQHDLQKICRIAELSGEHAPVAEAVFHNWGALRKAFGTFTALGAMVALFIASNKARITHSDIDVILFHGGLRNTADVMNLLAERGFSLTPDQLARVEEKVLRTALTYGLKPTTKHAIQHAITKHQALQMQAAMQAHRPAREGSSPGVGGL